MTKWYDRIGNSIEMMLYKNDEKTDFEWVKGKVIEGYRYQDGIITMVSNNGVKMQCGVSSETFRKADDSLGDLITNADRIRAMSDEELAEFMDNIENNPCEHCIVGTCDGFSGEQCKEKKVEWLKQEAEDD